MSYIPPRVCLANLPTPIDFLPRLSAFLNGPNILVKRDDLTGLALGGNKTRKLEYLIGEALANGADTLITAGVMQSNHCRQTAAAAAKNGLKCVLVLNGPPPTHVTSNLLLDMLLGAQIIWADNYIHREVIQKEVFEKKITDGNKPYFIPYGGTNSTGVLGYVFAMEETIKQGIESDWMVLNTTGGGTYAGLILGQKIFGYSGKILGIGGEPKVELRNHILKLVSGAAQKIGIDNIQINPEELIINNDFPEPDYGVLTENVQEAIKLFARHEGILLDPVYTGYAASGMINMIRNGILKKGETVLFWNTGGQVSLFDEKYQWKFP